MTGLQELAEVKKNIRIKSVVQSCPLTAVPTLTALSFCELTSVLGFKLEVACGVTALGYIQTGGLAM